MTYIYPARDRVAGKGMFAESADAQEVGFRLAGNERRKP